MIGEISVEFARDTADITDRQNIQLHWIRIEDVPEIWRRLEAVGLQHHRGLRRLPAGDPRLAGRRHRRGRDHRPDPGDPGHRRALHRRPAVLEPAAQVQDRASPAIPLQDVVPEINDIAFVGVEHPEHGPGFDLWVGGGLSTNPMLGRSGSAPGCPRTRSPRSGPASSASSATTATGGCAPGPG